MASLPTNTFMTAAEAVETVQEITPTLKLMSGHYQKASPLIDFAIDFWPVVAVGTFLAIMAGSASGAIAVQSVKRRLKR